MILLTFSKKMWRRRVRAEYKNCHFMLHISDRNWLFSFPYLRHSFLQSHFTTQGLETDWWENKNFRLICETSAMHLNTSCGREEKKILSAYHCNLIGHVSIASQKQYSTFTRKSIFQQQTKQKFCATRANEGGRKIFFWVSSAPLLFYVSWWRQSHK